MRTEDEFETFVAGFFDAQKREHAAAFRARLRALKTWDLRQFRLKYLLAKIVRHFDIAAYGEAGHEALATYLATNNEVEHILAQSASPAAKMEFGDGADDPEVIQSLGNLMLLEKSVNIVAGTEPYSAKCVVYPASKFLMSRCQQVPLQVGVNDKITRAMKLLDPAPVWTRAAVEQRQGWFAEVALDVWDVRRASTDVSEVGERATNLLSDS